MRRRGAACALLLAAAGCSGNGPAAPGAPASPVTLGEIRAVGVRAGESATLAVPVIVADGYHVQANPAANAFLVPLELTLEPADGVEAGSPAYPPPVRHRLEGAEEDLLTYEGRVAIEVPLAAATDASPDERVLTGRLRYQACDSRRCYFPTSLPLALGVVVER